MVVNPKTYLGTEVDRLYYRKVRNLNVAFGVLKTKVDDPNHIFK